MTTGSGFFVVIFQCFGQISDSSAVTPTNAKKSTGEDVAEESESSTNNVPASKVSIPHPTISFFFSFSFMVSGGVCSDSHHCCNPALFVAWVLVVCMYPAKSGNFMWF